MSSMMSSRRTGGDVIGHSVAKPLWCNWEHTQLQLERSGFKS